VNMKTRFAFLTTDGFTRWNFSLTFSGHFHFGVSSWHLRVKGFFQNNSPLPIDSSQLYPRF